MTTNSASSQDFNQAPVSPTEVDLAEERAGAMPVPPVEPELAEEGAAPVPPVEGERAEESAGAVPVPPAEPELAEEGAGAVPVPPAGVELSEESAGAVSVPPAPAERDPIQEELLQKWKSARKWTDEQSLGFVEFISVGETVSTNYQSRKLELGVRLSSPIRLDCQEELRAAESKIRNQMREILSIDPKSRKLAKTIDELQTEEHRLKNGIDHLRTKLERAQENWRAASDFLRIHGVSPTSWSFQVEIPSEEPSQPESEDEEIEDEDEEVEDEEEPRDF